MATGFNLLVAFLLVLLNGFFVAAEFARVKVRSTRVAQLADEGRASAETAFAVLVARAATTAADARSVRDDWRTFAADNTLDPHADEARVRVVELGLLAYKLGGDPADLRQAQEDARVYVARTDAGQARKVRRLIDSVEP